jgi:hypothetical protein
MSAHAYGKCTGEKRCLECCACCLRVLRHGCLRLSRLRFKRGWNRLSWCLYQPASPKKTGEGRCREGTAGAWWSTPLSLALGLLDVQGPGTRSERERVGGLAARSRRGVGARTGHARKSFDFNTSLCRATTHTLTTPSLWPPTVSSYSLATATQSWRALSRTGMSTPFSSISQRSSWRRCRRRLEASIFIVENVPQGIAVSLLRQPVAAERLGWALDLHSEFDRLRLRLTPPAGWE